MRAALGLGERRAAIPGWPSSTTPALPLPLAGPSLTSRAGCPVAASSSSSVPPLLLQRLQPLGLLLAVPLLLLLSQLVLQPACSRLDVGVG